MKELASFPNPIWLHACEYILSCKDEEDIQKEHITWSCKGKGPPQAHRHMEKEIRPKECLGLFDFNS